MKPTRIPWIDHAKGIGIALVVAGHVSSDIFFVTWLYSFHMPLFFFLSGITFKESNASKAGVKKITKRLLFPYLTYSILLVGLMLIISPLSGGLFGHFSFEKLAGIAVQWRSTPFTIGFWFLPLLLISQYLLVGVILATANSYIRIIVSGVIMVAGLTYAFFGLPQLPWAADAVLISMPFLFLGMMSKSQLMKLSQIKKSHALVICLMLLALNIACCVLNSTSGNRVDMWRGTYGNPILFVVGAVAGISFIVVLTAVVFRGIELNWLGYVGRNTLHIYCLHVAFILPVVSVVLGLIGLRNDGVSPFLYILNVITVLVASILMVVLIDYLRPYRQKFLNRLKTIKR